MASPQKHDSPRPAHSVTPGGSRLSDGNAAPGRSRVPGSCAVPASSGAPGRVRAGRAVRSVLGALRTHYPGFVLGLPVRKDSIPVFIYHDVERDRLAGDLEFLRRNRYRTLSLGEFAAAAAAKSGLPRGCGRCVLLTFDDARSNFHDTALPVLREFEARATLFAPTYWIGDPFPRTADMERFMTWDQLRSSAQSGLVDVQSHAHRHALVYTSGRLLEFANPRTLAGYDIYDWPMRNGYAGEELGRPALGTPIYAATPLLSASRRFVEDPEVAAACVRLVSRCGDAAFFERPDNAALLRRLHARRARTSPGHLSEHGSLRELVASEFEHSRDLFQKHLGYAPRYLAYPWMMGSALSLQLAKEFALEAVFGVALDFGRARRPDLPLSAFGRLKSDWLRLLPGSGRGSLLAIAAGKVAGISKTQHLAH